MNRWTRLLSPNSRNARFFLVVLVLVVAIILAFFYWRSRRGTLPPDIERGLARTLRAEELKALSRDSDGDGLRDWEELLFRTDPQNRDSDGDGTPDGEEVKQNRDPKKAGPEDPLGAATPQEAAQSDESKNLTADFTRQFLREPLAQIVAGKEAQIDTRAVERYAARLTRQSVLSDAPRFSKADIRIDSAPTKESITKYFTRFGAIFTALSKRGKNEIDIVTEVFRNQDYGELAGLTLYPDAYQKAVDDLRSLAAPKDAADFHLSVLNYLSKFKRSVELLQKAESDPILAMLAMHERLKLNDEFDASLEYLKKQSAAVLNSAK